jgi:hypothetical protein
MGNRAPTRASYSSSLISLQRGHGVQITVYTVIRIPVQSVLTIKKVRPFVIWCVCNNVIYYRQQKHPQDITAQRKPIIRPILHLEDASWTNSVLRYWSKTLLSGEPGSNVSVGASPGHERLTHWTSKTVYWSEDVGPPPPPPPAK